LWSFAANARSAWAQAAAVQVTGDSTRRLDILILGDGYTSAELPKYASDVNQFMAGVFLEEPFREYRNYVNVWRLDTPSLESGADHPERTPPVLKNTAFDAQYNCSGIQRLICVSTTKVFTAVNAVLPSQRDLIVVLVNDAEYGGSGGAIAVASTNAAAVELILHETGHTLAYLADEYTSQPPACVDTGEPVQVNTTKDTNRDTIKWRMWIEPNTAIPTGSSGSGLVGLFLGSRYCPNTLYRPTYDSKMRSLGRPYEQINTEQFIKRFYDFVDPVENKLPASTSIAITQNQNQLFSITTPQPATHSLTATWDLNGQPVATGLAYNLSAGNLGTGVYNLTATVSDPTPLVRSDPSGVLRQQISWTVTVSAGGPLPYTVPARGGNAFTTAGFGTLAVGHAVAQSSGSQFGLAIYRYINSGVTVAEAAVPASAKLSSGRIYGEVNGPLNTGVAISNTSSSDAVVSFFFTDTAGNTTPTGNLLLPARSQIARFLNEAPFGASQGFVGSFTFSSSVPVAAIALRTYRNERLESLFTTLPVVDLAAPAPSGSIVFPHFVAGGPWRTAVLLVNSGDSPLAGSLVFRNENGVPLTLTVDGQTNSSFSYTVAPRSARRLLAEGGPTLQRGSVLLTPDAGQSAPVGLVVFSYRPGAVTISEVGVTTMAPDTAFLLYAEALGNNFGQPNTIQPGIALANTSGNTITATVELRNMQGAVLGQGTVTVPPHGQKASFLSEIPGFSSVTGASPPYEGRLRISEPTGSLTMIGLLGRYNERGEFLMTTTPPVPEALPAASELAFPHFVNGEGFVTKFILLNSQAQQSSGQLIFYNQAGQITFPAMQ
jgi:hypothetical protein